jgi:hypothetical protein
VPGPVPSVQQPLEQPLEQPPEQPPVQTAMATVSIPAPTLGAAQEPVQDPAPAALAADPQQPAQGA